MASIRVATVTMSPIVVDMLITLLFPTAALEVVGRFDARANIESKVADLRPDLILIGLRMGESDDIASSLLEYCPRATIVAISDDGRNAYVHDARQQRLALSDVSSAALAAAVTASLRAPKI